MSDRSYDAGPYDIGTTYVHLLDGGAGKPLPLSPSFWDDVMAGKHPELNQGRLISQFVFSEDWPSWERHPSGEEVVMLLSGSADFVLDENGGERIVPLRHPGAYVLVPAGTWHTARTREPCTVLFVTPGRGTEHRAITKGPA